MWFPKFNLLSKILLKGFTEVCGLMFTSPARMFKSSGMVSYNTISLGQFMAVWDSSISTSISELGSDEDADNPLLNAQLWSDAFLMNKSMSFKKMLNRKALRLVAHLK